MTAWPPIRSTLIYDRINKDLIPIFEDLGLQITVQANLKDVDYFNVTLNLKTGTYQPYGKSNDTHRYMNSHSNHPPFI